MRPRQGGPTLKDVAQLAKVSIKTASRVLNEDPNVAPATRASVTLAIETLGYVPDPAAQSLRAGRDRTVGVIVDSIGDVFFAQLVAEIEARLDEAGYRSLIASSNRDPVRERETVQRLIQRRCSGVILSPTTRDSLTGVRLDDVPLVFVDRIGDVPGAQSVVVNDFELAKLATRHLISHGHRRIALLSDVPQVETTRVRHEGYRAAMADAGIPVDGRLMRMDCPDASQVMHALTELLALDEPPTAIISTNSRLSLGLVPALHQFGRTDVAVISYGDFAMAESLSPAVTVIDHSPQAIGAAAVEALLERLKPGSPISAPQAVIFVPARLIPRGSGELAPSVTDPEWPSINKEEHVHRN
ncbi:hypothetical protein BCR15_03955 [Tessaracoccus lapidicaptus]|uniref:Uncharacterized protein n=1 Tax=Tessaracoccus lapidicaptus TaxID=1427523 RepID=A0A1C0ALR1_9ACTN|nr:MULTISPECIES: LacI family DNA-binding transcriptional regulator [Tessaracoccus]AQX15434.1 LacI family transcriptional regulator [Tessaracoccus sp. T2.5-30]OCL33802.1 hypothetical protein BCR15_03955 [Tessaracoccus lapidicaptus]VEP39737.1 HTH-type transcriptional regulator GalR [Tessaracoccus lapidicaptus]